MTPTLSLVMRPELRLSALQILTVRLLVQPLAQLEDEIEDALEDNEFLERLDAPATPPDEPRPDAPAADEGPDPRDLDLAPRGERTLVSTEEREPFPIENFPGAAPSLAEHLLEQLRHAACDGAVRMAGEAIIGNLDDNGYLRAELAEIAAATGTPAVTVARALALVQGFDPTGVAARDLRECLVLHGVFPLRHFFQPGVPAATGGLVATMAAKANLRALIEGEGGRHPLSDLALAAALRQRGFVLARRTVAKYRGELAIPPCYRRTDRPRVMLGVDVPISLN